MLDWNLLMLCLHDKQSRQVVKLWHGVCTQGIHLIHQCQPVSSYSYNILRIKIHPVPSSLCICSLCPNIVCAPEHDICYGVACSVKKKKRVEEEGKDFLKDVKCEISNPQIAWIKTPAVTSFHCPRPRKYIHACIYSFIHRVSAGH